MYLLTDVNGNEIATTSEELAIEICSSGCNPFTEFKKIENYDGIIVDSYEDFCNVFY